jgi:hypothetical protein
MAFYWRWIAYVLFGSWYPNVGWDDFGEHGFFHFVLKLVFLMATWCWLQVLTVPFIAGLMGKKIPVLTWCAAVAALFGVGLLETSGAPPSVRSHLSRRHHLVVALDDTFI